MAIVKEKHELNYLEVKTAIRVGRTDLEPGDGIVIDNAPEALEDGDLIMCRVHGDTLVFEGEVLKVHLDLTSQARMEMVRCGEPQPVPHC